MQGVPGKLRILSGGFGESKPVQFRIDLNRLHATIIRRQWNSRITFEATQDIPRNLDLPRSIRSPRLEHERITRALTPASSSPSSVAMPLCGTMRHETGGPKTAFDDEFRRRFGRPVFAAATHTRTRGIRPGSRGWSSNG